MKKILYAILVCLTLSSCGTVRLYDWGGYRDVMKKDVTKYEDLIYKNYHNQTPESICDLLCLYDKMVTNPGGDRGIVPPGIYAEYGYLLLMPETSSIFDQYATTRQKKALGMSDYSTTFYEKGILMLKKEVELYPEAAKFIEPLIKKLSKK